MSEDNSIIDQKVIFICGAPHSGSTLLGLILGSHTQCFYAGEANKVKFLNSEDQQPDRYCKICGPDCTIWSDFLYEENMNTYQWLSEKTLKLNIIDSTKNLDWVKSQIFKLKNSNFQIYLIYLLRDGRAVINSRLRKYKNSEPQDIIDEWINHMENTDTFYQNFSYHKKKVHYEELAINPDKIVKELCPFLGISYEAEMLKYYNHQHHPLGGNIGTQSLIVKAREEKIKNQYIHLSERNEYYYLDHPLSIKLDLRWMEELDPNIKDLFERKAGRINQPMKWEIKEEFVNTKIKQKEY